MGVDQEAITGTAEFEAALAHVDEGYFVLRLYLTGGTPRSVQAVAAIKSLCEQHLKGRYELEVVDLYQNPDRAQDAQIIAAPTLVREMPPPLKRLIGDLGDPDRVMIALDLKPMKD